MGRPFFARLKRDDGLIWPAVTINASRNTLQITIKSCQIALEKDMPHGPTRASLIFSPLLVAVYFPTFFHLFFLAALEPSLPPFGYFSVSISFSRLSVFFHWQSLMAPSRTYTFAPLSHFLFLLRAARSGAFLTGPLFFVINSLFLSFPPAPVILRLCA